MPIVAFRIGREPLFTYSLMMALGLVAGVLGLAVEGRRRGWCGDEVLEILAWAVVPATLGGRAAYVAALGFDGAPALRALVHPWGEGLLFPAALLAGALGLAVLAAWRRRPFISLLGAAVPGLALGQALGWIGAAAHGVWAGVAMPAARWAPHLRDLYGVVLPRFPLQYLAAGLSLITWLLLVSGWPRGDRGRVACYALLSGWGLAALARWRDARQPLLAGLSLEQVAYLALGLAGLTLLLGRRRRLQPAPRIG